MVRERTATAARAIVPAAISRRESGERVARCAGPVVLVRSATRAGQPRCQAQPRLMKIAALGQQMAGLIDVLRGPPPVASSRNKRWGFVDREQSTLVSAQASTRAPRAGPAGRSGSPETSKRDHGSPRAGRSRTKRLTHTAELSTKGRGSPSRSMNASDRKANSSSCASPWR